MQHIHRQNNPIFVTTTTVNIDFIVGWHDAKVSMIHRDEDTNLV